MEQFIGLDVSQKTTHLCIVAGDGRTVWQGQCASTPEAIATTIKARADQVIRIGLESGPLSTWHWHALKALGLPVVCLDARHAQATLGLQINKTDRNDAHGLAQMVRMGWYRAVEVKSLASHNARALLGIRAQLVGMQTKVTNQLRGILKTFGLVLGKGGGRAFDQQVEAWAPQTGLLGDSVRALLAVLRNLREQLRNLNRAVRAFGQQQPVCLHLMSVPGVGRLTAMAFVTAIDNPTRFRRSRNVGAYLGLTPRRYQSGELDLGGRISRCGDPLLRGYLYEAANVLLTRVTLWSTLKAWGLRLARRVGMKKARVAVARKLAVLLHRMWVTGEAYRWSEPAAAA